MHDYRIFWTKIVQGLDEGPQHLPILPGIEDTYRHTRSALPLVARNQLAALGQLANLVLHADRPKRLPVQALGAYQGVNILSIDGRFIVASNNLDIDFVEIGTELHAITPDGGLTALKLGEPVGGRPAQMIRAGDVEAAKRVIDSLLR